jgi:hypothetical protein
MSDSAKTLLYWVSNASCTDDADERHCLECARKWAAWIIAGKD